MHATQSMVRPTLPAGSFDSAPHLGAADSPAQRCAQDDAQTPRRGASGVARGCFSAARLWRVPHCCTHRCLRPTPREDVVRPACQRLCRPITPERECHPEGGAAPSSPRAPTRAPTEGSRHGPRHERVTAWRAAHRRTRPGVRCTPRSRWCARHSRRDPSTPRHTWERLTVRRSATLRMTLRRRRAGRAGCSHRALRTPDRNMLLGLSCACTGQRETPPFRRRFASRSSPAARRRAFPAKTSAPFT
jgi:hypothetical protein